MLDSVTQIHLPMRDYTILAHETVSAASLLQRVIKTVLNGKTSKVQQKILYCKTMSIYISKYLEYKWGLAQLSLSWLAGIGGWS